MFDNQTIAFLMQPGVVAALLAQLVNWWSNRDTPGVKWWSVGMALGTIGIVVRAQPLAAPEWVIVPVVNLLIVGGDFVVLYGLCRFAGRPMFRLPAAVTLLFLALGQVYFAAVRDDLFMRTAVLTIGIAVPFLLQLRLLRIFARREGVAGILMLLVAYGLTVAALVIRLVVMAIKGGAPVGMMHLDDSMALAGPQAIASMLAVAVATAYSYGFIMLVGSHARWQLRQVAIVDALTGAPNRRAFDTELQHLILRARRNRGHVCLALMDLDRFKQVNDTHGHAVGDAVLRHFATVVQRTLRESDFFARVGGEEFALLLADAAPDALHRGAERVRQAIEQEPFMLPSGEPLAVTVSIGAVTSEPGGGEAEALYKAADAALYRAKSQGRNRVEVDHPATPAAANDSAVASVAAPPPMPKIFTIGHEVEYDAALVRANGTPITKRGPYLQADGTQYYGGYAFETVAAAYAYIAKLGKTGEWAAYEVDATWTEDIWHPHAVEDFRRLNRDAVLLRKMSLEASVPQPALSGGQTA
jgi:diguanylate cyclase (GGDEF)-like protein